MQYSILFFLTLNNSFYFWLMNLIIDKGNTKIKLYIFKHSEIQFFKSISEAVLKDVLNEISSQFKIQKIIVSTVGKDFNFNMNNIFPKVENVIHLNSTLKVPFKNTYKTPNTLGADRIALISSAFMKYPNENTLVIDAGSCITFDFINKESDYLGGAISPGIQMRFEALNNYTAKLPLVEFNDIDFLIGGDTKESILSGVLNGVVSEIDGVISQYRDRFKKLNVVLTGGNVNFLSKQLKSSIFVHQNFIFEGLNYLLEYNTTQC
jgi:type III pantothenate kinase